MAHPKVLIIDGELTVKASAEGALKREGYDLLFAVDGEIGLIEADQLGVLGVPQKCIEIRRLRYLVDLGSHAGQR